MQSNLSSDVIVEILMRLPVKSICRFKCVCKLWCLLISDPTFIKRHLNLAIIDKDIEHQRQKLILRSSSTPSLELKRIPNFYIDINRSLDDRVSRPLVYGFGYDHSFDDYNVVKFMYESIVYVYSLKTDTWRRAQRFSYRRFNSDSGVHLNGAVHWVFARGKDSSLVSMPRLIVAFDFAEGMFRELPRPYDDAENVTAIGVLGGCLCWLGEQQDFWVMKEYAVKESWTKVVIGVPFLNLRPSFLKNDEALLVINEGLIVYNPKEDTHREIVIHGINGRGNLEIETYVESLVSLNV
ncbi:F-box/kelch-repeat protein At3g06240 [Gossypium hirsutum]|uniref:F-box/kelch-repeat protein At3g06240 n=1 Tax=Gossypium hirsutum TaxID=3635 RepID=A0A1U8IEP4_GOSHI|nr:F-box/kelch-repeat protein At3g06240-like [Gossypium hirsutum]